jgi:hypothetical protein
MASASVASFKVSVVLGLAATTPSSCAGSRLRRGLDQGIAATGPENLATQPMKWLQRVTVSLYGLAAQTAIFRDGLGCTLIEGKGEDTLRAKRQLFHPPTLRHPGLAASRSTLLLQLRVSMRQSWTQRSRRFVHGGRIVAERYAAGLQYKDAATWLVDDQGCAQRAYRSQNQGRQARPH